MSRHQQHQHQHQLSSPTIYHHQQNPYNDTNNNYTTSTGSGSASRSASSSTATVAAAAAAAAATVIPRVETSSVADHSYNDHYQQHSYHSHSLLLSPPTTGGLSSSHKSDNPYSPSSSSRLPSIRPLPRQPSLFQPPPPREDTGYRLESRGRIPAIVIPPVPYNTTSNKSNSRRNSSSNINNSSTDTPTLYSHSRAGPGSPYEQPHLAPISGGLPSASAGPSSSRHHHHPSLQSLAFGQPSPSGNSQSHSRSPYASQFFNLALSNPLSASSTASYGERVLRSPHPPLTASLHPSQSQSSHLWPLALPHIHSSPCTHSLSHHSHTHSKSHSHSQSPQPQSQPQSRAQRLTHDSIGTTGRSYYAASGDFPSVPGPSTSSSNGPYRSHHFDHPSATTSYLASTNVHSSTRSHTQSRGSSPLHIPPPLRFNYSASPPTLHNPGSDMPPRRKAAAAAAAPDSSGAASSSATRTMSTATTNTNPGSGTRAGRKAAANGKGWTMEHTYDSVGQKKEVIVIDDSASPMIPQPPRKRTRAQVAAEQAQAQAQAQGHGVYNGSGNSIMSNGYAGSTASLSASTKKRKVDDPSEQGSAKKAKGKLASSATSASVQATGGTWAHQQPVPPPKAAAYQKPAATTSQSSQNAAQPPWDDSEGHYIVKPDDVIGGRYKIVRLLGQGTFGKVVEARHIETRQKVAIKVIRAVQKYRDASKIEIRVLETLKKHDPRNDNKCIHLEEYFDFRNHPCLVSELYGMSVFDFLKQNSFQAFPEKHIQDFAKSLLRSVAFLHTLKLVHTDLKPENILLCSNEARLVGPRARGARSKSILRNTEIRLIDFGSATFESEYHSSVVSTRHYRAPEIILGLPWSYPCDMFSIGCILVEFYTGDALFQTHDNLEHLAMMEVVMGKFSPRMIEKGRHKKPEFFRGNKIDFPNANVSKASRKFVKQMKSLKDIIQPTTRHQQLFLDLCVRLLEHDPDVRIKVQDALRHPYLTEPIPDPL